MPAGNGAAALACTSLPRPPLVPVGKGTALLACTGCRTRLHFPPLPSPRPSRQGDGLTRRLRLIPPSHAAVDAAASSFCGDGGRGGSGGRDLQLGATASCLSIAIADFRTSRPRRRARTLCLSLPRQRALGGCHAAPDETMGVPLPASGSKPDRTLRSAELKHGESPTRLSPPPLLPFGGCWPRPCAARSRRTGRRVVSHASTFRRHGTSPVPVCSQSDFPSAAGAARHSAPPGLRSCCRPRPTRPPPPQRTDRSPTSPPSFFPLNPRGRQRDAVPSHPPPAAAPSRWLLPAAANGGLAAGAAVAAKASQMAFTAGWGGRRAEPPQGRRATRRGERRAVPSACRQRTRRPPPDVPAGDQPDDLT